LPKPTLISATAAAPFNSSSKAF